jgi:hypothetical protein
VLSPSAGALEAAFTTRAPPTLEGGRVVRRINAMHLASKCDFSGISHSYITMELSAKVTLRRRLMELTGQMSSSASRPRDRPARQITERSRGEERHTITISSDPGGPRIGAPRRVIWGVLTLRAFTFKG